MSSVSVAHPLKDTNRQIWCIFLIRISKRKLVCCGVWDRSADSRFRILALLRLIKAPYVLVCAWIAKFSYWGLTHNLWG